MRLPWSKKKDPGALNFLQRNIEIRRLNEMILRVHPIAKLWGSRMPDTRAPVENIIDGARRLAQAEKIVRHLKRLAEVAMKAKVKIDRLERGT